MPRGSTTAAIMIEAIDLEKELWHRRFDVRRYNYKRKFVRIARHPRLADPMNWPRLPDSFGSLYELSFLRPSDPFAERGQNESTLRFELVDDLLDLGYINKTTSIEKVKELCHHLRRGRLLQDWPG